MALDRQEAFNKVWDWFVVQKKPASIKPGSPLYKRLECLYRGPNGEKCAVGVLIPDDFLYLNEILHENNTPESWPKPFLKALNWSRDDTFWLRDLQKTHDNSCPGPDSFHTDIQNNLRQFAAENGLTVPTL